MVNWSESSAPQRHRRFINGFRTPLLSSVVVSNYAARNGQGVTPPRPRNLRRRMQSNISKNCNSNITTTRPKTMIASEVELLMKGACDQRKRTNSNMISNISLLRPKGVSSMRVKNEPRTVNLPIDYSDFSVLENNQSGIQTKTACSDRAKSAGTTGPNQYTNIDIPISARHIQLNHENGTSEEDVILQASSPEHQHLQLTQQLNQFQDRNFDKTILSCDCANTFTDGSKRDSCTAIIKNFQKEKNDICKYQSNVCTVSTPYDIRRESIEKSSTQLHTENFRDKLLITRQISIGGHNHPKYQTQNLHDLNQISHKSPQINFKKKQNPKGITKPRIPKELSCVTKVQQNKNANQKKRTSNMRVKANRSYLQSSVLNGKNESWMKFLELPCWKTRNKIESLQKNNTETSTTKNYNFSENQTLENSMPSLLCISAASDYATTTCFSPLSLQSHSRQLLCENQGSAKISKQNTIKLKTEIATSSLMCKSIFKKPPKLKKFSREYKRPNKLEPRPGIICGEHMTQVTGDK